MIPAEDAGSGSTSSSRLVTLTLNGSAGPLEALLTEREGERASLGVVVCHPHPLYGGTMHNKVVHRVASTLHGLGATVLRFNFRGVGQSAGTHDRGAGELDDARVALDFLHERLPGARLWIAGFSFGAWIGARLTAKAPEIEKLILVAPGIRTSSFASMHECTTPKLVLQGTADTTCPLEDLEREFPSWAPPKRLEKIEGASHFFDRQLGALGERLAAAVREEGWV